MLDLLLAVALVVATALGYYWGLIRGLLVLLALAVGALAASRLGPVVGDWLTSFVADETAYPLGALLALLAVCLAGDTAASALRLFVGLLFVGPLDHLLGAVLGLLHALLVAGALLVIGGTHRSWAALASGSLLATALARAARALLPLGSLA